MPDRDSLFTLAVRISYRPPGLLLYIVMLSHTGALVCVLATSLPAVGRASLAMILFLHCLYYLFAWYRQYHQRPLPVLCLRRSGEWRLIEDGEEHTLRLCEAGFVHRLLVVLRFTAGNRRPRGFVLTRENVDATTLRRLRVRLLHGAGTGPGT